MATAVCPRDGCISGIDEGIPIYREYMFVLWFKGFTGMSLECLANALPITVLCQDDAFMQCTHIPYKMIFLDAWQISHPSQPPQKIKDPLSTLLQPKTPVFLLQMENSPIDQYRVKSIRKADK